MTSTDQYLVSLINVAKVVHCVLFSEMIFLFASKILVHYRLIRFS